MLTSIPTALILAGDNDRTTFNPVALQELADSIAAHGLAQPITVRPLWLCETCGAVHSSPSPCPCVFPSSSSAPRYQVVAGERRLRAIRDLLNWPTAPCIVRELSDEDASAIMLAENTDRVDLNPIEEANAYHKRQTRFAWDIDRIAHTAGFSPDHVRRRLALLTLTADIQPLVASGNLPLAHAETLARLDPNRQRIALRAFQASDAVPDIIMFRRLCSRLYEQQLQDTLIDLDDYMVAKMLEQAGRPRTGQEADTTHIPTSPDLPAVTYTRKDTAAVIIERWLQDLTAAGHLSEAAAVGTLYKTLIHACLLRIPYETTLIHP